MFMEFIKVVVIGILSSVCVLLGGFMWDALTDTNNVLPDAMRSCLKVVSVFLLVSSVVFAMACVWSLGCFIVNMFV